MPSTTQPTERHLGSWGSYTSKNIKATKRTKVLKTKYLKLKFKIKKQKGTKEKEKEIAKKVDFQWVHIIMIQIHNVSKTVNIFFTRIKKLTSNW